MISAKAAESESELARTRCRVQGRCMRDIQRTVGSDEKFQIPGQEIIFEISGPGPSYLSIGTSQDHIWSYFEHMCWSAQVECVGV